MIQDLDINPSLLSTRLLFCSLSAKKKPKATKFRKFAAVKKMINPNDSRLKINQQKEEEKKKKAEEASKKHV